MKKKRLVKPLYCIFKSCSSSSCSAVQTLTISCFRNSILLSSLFKSAELAQHLQLPKCGAADFSCFPPARERMRLSGTFRPNFVSISLKSRATLLSSSIVGRPKTESRQFAASLEVIFPKGLFGRGDARELRSKTSRVKGAAKFQDARAHRSFSR